MKLFEIKDDQLIFYPNKKTGVMLSILSTVIVLFFGVLTYLPFSENAEWRTTFILCIALACLVCIGLPLLYARVSIVIDKQDGTITRKSIFGNNLLTTLDEVYIARLTEIQGGYVTMYMATLILKEDTYGQGILLTHQFRQKSKFFAQFDQEVIPHINSLLQHDHEINEIPLEQYQLKIFKEDQRDKYVFKEPMIGKVSFGVLFLAAFLFVQFFLQKDEFYQYIFLGVSCFAFLLCLNKITVDTYNKNIEKLSFGLFKINCHFLEVRNFDTIRHLTNGQYSGTEILIKTNRDTKPYQISLIQLKDTKKVASIIDDLNYFMNTSS